MSMRISYIIKSHISQIQISKRMAVNGFVVILFKQVSQHRISSSHTLSVLIHTDYGIPQLFEKHVLYVWPVDCVNV